MKEIIAGPPIKGCLYRTGWQERFPCGEKGGKCCCRERGRRRGSVERPAPTGRASLDEIRQGEFVTHKALKRDLEME
ncbi:MAG: hypothetical protein CVV31_13640 [Methanomicrobiales archaeon HGW-Methanomicrobiales-2]|nr:MAG: hypothetical protein CVV31_13640 [Methanomicrobiales archaeon HGW-Methanomicrobiales-2]